MTFEFFFFFIPTIAILVGGLTALFYLPGQKLTSMTQHFAAGFEFHQLQWALFDLGLLLAALLVIFCLFLETKSIAA